MSNPANRLVPYLDLFERLDDTELARLAGVDAATAGTLRQQVLQTTTALARYADLLDRLSDTELARITGAGEKTIRFFRLCSVAPERPELKEGATPVAAGNVPDASISQVGMPIEHGVPRAAAPQESDMQIVVEDSSTDPFADEEESLEVDWSDL